MARAERDRDVVRQLAEQVAEIAALPVHGQTVESWGRLNDLQPVKPLVWINEMPWHETEGDEELAVTSEDPFCRAVETDLRRVIYQWRHMPGDMVVEGKLYAPLVIRDSGFGISEDVDIVMTDARSDVVSRDFHPQIDNESDLDKIKFPEISHDAAASQRDYEQLQALVGDILPVEQRGVVGTWFAPWDELVRWWDVEKVLLDLVLRPELVHQAMDRLVNACLQRLDQWEELGLLSLNNTNVRIGSGGLGYTDELPQPDFDASHVRPVDMWGFATAQIFGAVSPEMHWEFALQYEKRWLDRFGLTYYGCCEPLHDKLEMLKANIPNLRKISMSPWVDVDKAVGQVGADYIFSYKPNPAIFADEDWHPDRVRRELRETLAKTRGCVVEVIMKDISTVRYQPQRLWDWAQIAREETERVV